MMSLFSSFDALFAESLGYKFKLSMFPNRKPDSSSSSFSAVRSVKKDGEDNSKTDSSSNRNGNSSSSSPPSQRRPRFAPEFDGVHCFETIIPY